MKVKCTKCRMEVYKLRTNATAGDKQASMMFKGINGFTHPKPGEEFRCPNCLSVEGLSGGVQNVIKAIIQGDSTRKNMGGMV